MWALWEQTRKERVWRVHPILSSGFPAYHLERHLGPSSANFGLRSATFGVWILLAPQGALGAQAFQDCKCVAVLLPSLIRMLKLNILPNHERPASYRPFSSLRTGAIRTESPCLLLRAVSWNISLLLFNENAKSLQPQSSNIFRPSLQFFKLWRQLGRATVAAALYNLRPSSKALFHTAHTPPTCTYTTQPLMDILLGILLHVLY